jgi:hypothetical protein
LPNADHWGEDYFAVALVHIHGDGSRIHHEACTTIFRDFPDSPARAASIG